MSFFSWLGNLIHGGEQQAANFVNHNVVQPVRRDVQQVQQGAQRAVNVITHPAPPRLNLPHPGIHPIVQAAHDIVHAAQYGPAGIAGYGLQQGSHNIQRVENAIAHTGVAKNIAKVKIPVAGNIGNATRALVGEGILDPAVRAAQTGGGALQGQKINNPRQFASDAAQTALNVGTGGVGSDILKQGLKAGIKQGAKAGAKIGAAQGGVQSYRDKANLKQTAVNVAGGAALGGAIGAATPVAGAAVKGVAREVKAGLPQIKNEKGYLGGMSATSADKAQAKGKTFGWVDGTKRFEQSDKGAKILDKGVAKLSRGHAVALSDVLQHKQLSKDYPTFFGGGPGEIKLAVDPHTPHRAYYSPDTNSIHLHPQTLNQLKGQSGKSVLIHEVQHAIDNYEGVPRGSSPEAVQASLQHPEVTQAQNAIKTYEAPYQTLKQAQAKGHITSQQFQNDPIVQAYTKAQQVIKTNPGATPADIHQAYNRTPAELTANAAESRSWMGQKQLDNTPIGQQPRPYVLPAEANGVMAKMEDPKIQGNRFTQGVKASPEVSPEVQGAVSGQHAQRSTAQLSEDANAALNHFGLDKATQATHDRLSVKDGQITDEDVAHAITVAKANDAKGNHDAATIIYDNLSNHLVKAGQTVQAASLLLRRTPEGLKFGAQRVLKKAGVELTPEIKKSIETGIAKIKSLPEGSQERDYAVAEFQKMVSGHIPSNLTDKAIGIWKAGLLTGLRTQTGNALSNVANTTLKKVSDPLAAGFDKGISLVTGRRTKTATLKGLGSGTVEGVKAGAKYMKTGVDERNLSHLKYDTKSLNYGKGPLGKAAQTYTDGVFKLMGAADRPYYYANLRNTLADMGKADGLNQGLKGQALTEHVNKFMQEPPEKAFQAATGAAEKSVFANDTALSHIAAGLRQGASKNPVTNAAINIIAPFTRVPSSVITQVFDYTPVGAIKEIISNARNGLDQRALSEALAKSTTGSAGVIAAGAALANQGLLSGAYPKDPKEQARWKAEGKQPNSILVNGKWRSLNYISPFGPLLGMGQNLAEGLQQGQGLLGSLVSAAGGGAQTALSQSFLQGVQGVLDAVNDPKRYATKFVQNTGASVIPTLVGDIAKAGDPLQRQANSTIDAIKNKIPGLRETNIPAIDAFGNPLKNNNSPLQTMLDPTRPTEQNSSPLTNELDRLGQNGQSIFPTPDKTIQVGKNQIKLTPQQATDWNKQIGQQTQTTWTQITQSAGYQNLSDDKKKAALQSASDDIRAVEKVKYLQSLGEPQNDNMRAAYDNLTKNQKKILAGDQAYDPNAYIKKQEPKAPKIARAKKGARVAKGRGRRVAIAKPPKLSIKPVHIKVGKSKVSNAKVAKAHYVKAKNIATTGKKVTLTV